MEHLLDTLKERLLPLVYSRGVRVVASTTDFGKARTIEPTASFIEAYRPEHHTFFEAMWLLSGVAHLKVNSHLHTLAAGDLCLLPPLHSHADVFNRETAAYESLWFAYWPGTLSINFFSYTPFGQTKATPLGVIGGWPEIPATFAALHREVGQPDAYSDDATHALLLHLIVLLMRSVESCIRQPLVSVCNGEVSHRVHCYLAEHYAEKVTLGEIARALHRTPNHVASVFKQETGYTIFDVLSRIRIENSVRLLLEEGMTVHEVAYAVGYNSAEHFSRTFRQLKGIAPSQYGRQLEFESEANREIGTRS